MCQDRIIISLNPDINPTGKKMPKTIKEEMVSDSDFLELSSEEQLALLKKVDTLIQSPTDIIQYGTLKEKYDEVLKMYSQKESGLRYYLVMGNYNSKLNENVKDGTTNNIDSIANLIFKYKDGCILDEGEDIMSLCVRILKLEVEKSETTPSQIMSVLEETITNPVGTLLSAVGSLVELWKITMPYTGKVFALTAFTSSRGSDAEKHQKSWNEDILIIGSEDDTREEILAWYKEATGKIPSYKTDKEIQDEKALSKERIKKVASKWGI